MKRVRRPYGSEEGHRERQERWQRSVYGGGNKGAHAKPSTGRLSAVQKKMETLLQTFYREGNEFTHSQGNAVVTALEKEIEKFRKAVSEKGKPDPAPAR